MNPPSPPAPPAAWYPDPGGSGGLRYWDGAGWTDHLTPPPWATAPRGAAGPASGPAGVPAPLAAPKRRLWPLFALIGVLFISGVAAAVALGVPRLVDAGGRATDRAAQAAARDAVDAARAIRAAEGSYLAVTPERLAEVEPDLTFTRGASTDFTTVSVHASSEQQITVAVRALSGRCFVITESDGIESAGRMRADGACVAVLAFGGIVPEDF